MREVLRLDPANHGCTILMRNNGKTYRFHIPIAPIPTIEPDAKPSQPKRKPRKATPTTSSRKEPIS